ncbi:Hypothetical predicted protein [Mytilus galloprovincialis]|uniref:G-protein coupled receptors family 1 profile domain-containing protein n=1 Tax=Mytilus galloprovincialis TaxID=29158 RepID=A0A8B6GZ83_MYTGA|nr:Hypothetical predicted protein [Mytilus galloprovincialis]
MKGEINNTCHVKSSIFTIGRNSVSSSKNASVDKKQNLRKADDTSVMTIEDIDIQLEDVSVNSNCDNKVSHTNICVQEEILNKGMIDLKSNTNLCTTSTDVAISTDVNTQSQKSWEIRAFFTTLIIAFQTVILTSPFVVSYWMEISSSTPLTLQMRIILLFPFLINSLSNPLIYAWRIPEIRQEFRRLFRIGT